MPIPKLQILGIAHLREQNVANLINLTKSFAGYSINSYEMLNIEQHNPSLHYKSK